jgi:hypothetical protein
VDWGTAVVVVLVGALVAGCGGSGGGPPRGVAPPPPRGAHPELLASFAVLERPARASDALPPGTSVPDGVDRGAARRVGRSPSLRVWLVPGPREVCLVEDFVRGRAGGLDCSPVAGDDGIATGDRPLTGKILGPWRRYRAIAYAVVPDGSSGARLERNGRVIRRLRIHDNGLITRGIGATHLSWRTPGGTRRRLPLR